MKDQISEEKIFNTIGDEGESERERERERERGERGEREKEREREKREREREGPTKIRFGDTGDEFCNRVVVSYRCGVKRGDEGVVEDLCRRTENSNRLHTSIKRGGKGKRKQQTTRKKRRKE